MAYLIHKTLRKPCNVLDVIPGKWYPNADGAQYLFNNHTHFDLYRFVQTSSGSKFVKFYQQLFMSKVYSICAGQEINDITSFYALRDYDIIQLIYSSTEEIFVLRYRINFPQYLSFSNFLYFSDSTLFISSARGATGTVDFLPNKNVPNFIDQKTIVLQNFTLKKNGFIGRIEAGPAISIYEKKPFRLRLKKSFPNIFISCVFELQNGSLAICTMASIMVINLNDEKAETIEIPLPLIGPQIEPAERKDFITDICNLDENSNVLLSSLGKIFLMQNTDISLIMKDSKISRIFALTDELVLFTMKGHDHIIRNIIKKQNYSKIHSNVGQNGLYLGSQTTYLAPHTFSYSNDLLLIGKQGLNVLTLSSHDFCEPIYGLHSFRTANHNFIVVSFQNSSKLLEVVDNEIKVPEQTIIKESVQTLGICHLLSGQGMNIVFQVTPDGLLLYKAKMQSCDYVLNVSAQSAHIICYVSNTRQILLFLSNKTVYMIQLNLKTNNSENVSFNVNSYVTAMALTEPDKTTGLSEYVAYGVFDSQSSYIEIHSVSLDQAARTRIISEKMPSKVSSIKIVNYKDEEAEVMKILIGLDDGTIVIGNIDIVQRVIDKVTMIQFGSGPINLTSIYPKYENPIFLALNSRPLLINFIRGLPRFCPLAISSVGYATGIAEKNLFILASGNSINVSTIYNTDSLSSEDETSMTMARIKFPSRIVSVLPILNDRFTFVSLSNSVYLFDSCKTALAHKDPLISLTNEVICATCSGGNANVFQLCIGTVKRADESEQPGQGEITSIIRLCNVIIGQQGVQSKAPIVGECKMPVTSVCIALQSTVFAACGDTLFCFKPYEDSLRVVARIGGVGTCIRNLVYLPPISRYTKGEIFAGDSSKSVKLFRFCEASKEFKLKAEEGTTRNITALAKYDERYVCGGDVLGNVFILEYPQISVNSNSVLDKENFKAKRRLTLKFNFFVGDSVTGVQYTSNIFSCLWYSTVSGGLGGFISYYGDQNGSIQFIRYWQAEFSKSCQLLKRVELEVSQIYLQLTGCDHISYRNKFFPSSNVIDLDMVEIYLMLSDEIKNKIALNIMESTKTSSIRFDSLKPIDIEFEINKFRKYFIEWHSKR